MKRLVVLAIAGVFVALVAYGVLTFYDHSMSLGRMWETPAVKPHEEPLLVMQKGLVPFGGGEAKLRAAALLTPPAGMDLKAQKTVDAGLIAYQNYCLHCHGSNLDGQGRVGQSFAPLPANLRSVDVLAKSDTNLFKAISYGGGRAPALATTVSVIDRWNIIAYLRATDNS
jgi:mono/diheme cytochrome c family protein